MSGTFRYLLRSRIIHPNISTSAVRPSTKSVPSNISTMATLGTFKLPNIQNDPNVSRRIVYVARVQDILTFPEETLRQRLCGPRGSCCGHRSISETCSPRDSPYYWRQIGTIKPRFSRRFSLLIASLRSPTPASQHKTTLPLIRPRLQNTLMHRRSRSNKPLTRH